MATLSFWGMSPGQGAMRRVDDDRRWPVEPGPFPHLARLVDLPPLTAQAAFDAVRSERSRGSQPCRWVVAAGEGRLELTGEGYVRSPPRPCYWSYREVSGRIRSQRWPLAIPVRLLLLPWSATRSALAVEVRGHPWVYAAERLYVDAGHEALRVLARELEDWALAETKEVDAWLDSLLANADDERD